MNEITPEENETILKDNRYLVADPRFKPRYDAIEILIHASFPELKDEGERFVCAFEIGKFLNSVGLGGCEANVIEFLNFIGTTHSMVLLKNLNKELLGILSRDNRFTQYHLMIGDIMSFKS